jgi:hypothetical protein
MSIRGVPGAGPAFWAWRALLLGLALNFLAATAAIVGGDFDNAGLPARMLPMEVVNNAAEALLWGLVLVLSMRRRPGFAPELAVFLSGFFWFDVLTTHALVMPIPPGFLWWGSATAVLMLMAAKRLALRRTVLALPAGLAQRPPAAPASPRLAIGLCLVVGAGFLGTVASLLNGDYAHSGLPAAVLPWHTAANLIEAVLWLMSAGLLWAGSSRAAGWVGLFAAGMFTWDMLTTAFLPGMPIPGQPVWGPVAALLMLWLTRRLRGSTT